MNFEANIYVVTDGPRGFEQHKHAMERYVIDEDTGTMVIIGPGNNQSDIYNMANVQMYWTDKQAHLDGNRNYAVWFKHGFNTELNFDGIDYGTNPFNTSPNDHIVDGWYNLVRAVPGNEKRPLEHFVCGRVRIENLLRIGAK